MSSWSLISIVNKLKEIDITSHIHSLSGLVDALKNSSKLVNWMKIQT